MSFLIKIRMSMCAQELKWELEAMSVAKRSDVLTSTTLLYMAIFKPLLIEFGLIDRFPLLTDDETYRLYTGAEDVRNEMIKSYKDVMEEAGKKELPGNLHHLFYVAHRRAVEVIMCSFASNVNGHENIIKIWEMLPKEEKQHAESIDRYFDGIEKLEKYPFPFIEMFKSVDTKLWESNCLNIFNEMNFNR